MAVTKLQLNENKKFLCPTCGQELKKIEGGAVRVVDGRVDMSVTLPKYVCASCNVYYQELLNSGYFDVFELPEELKPKRVVKTGDLQPMILKREADGKCACPRCGERMDYVDGQAVRIVDGKPDFENVKAHFKCPYCNSVYRRIASTEYFQWSEK